MKTSVVFCLLVGVTCVSSRITEDVINDYLEVSLQWINLILYSESSALTAIFDGSKRATLVVTFGFLTQYFGRW